LINDDNLEHLVDVDVEISINTGGVNDEQDFANSQGQIQLLLIEYCEFVR